MKGGLSFTDDKGVEKKWLRDSPRTAAAEFWEFVGDRSAADNEVFTIEDEEMGEGIQLHFYAAPSPGSRRCERVKAGRIRSTGSSTVWSTGWAGTGTW